MVVGGWTVVQRSLSSLLDNDENATEQPTDRPTFVVLFRLRSAHTTTAHLLLSIGGWWGIWLSMKQHYSSGRRKGQKEFTDNKKSDYYVQEQA